MPSKQNRIFVVDDEEIIATSLAMVLTNFGFNATPFSHPLRALDACHLESPDFLISDAIMPEISGVELAIRMLKICPNCRVMLLTGQSDKQGLLEAAQASGNHFEVVSKPTPPLELIRKIQVGFGLPRAS